MALRSILNPIASSKFKNISTDVNGHLKLYLSNKTANANGMVKLAKCTINCKGDKVIALKRQISFR